MKDFEQLASSAKKVSLSGDERSRVRELLSQYLAMHPVRADASRRHLWQQRSSIFSVLATVTRTLIIKPMPVILIIALLLGGSASFAAERALPGNVLYPVKIHVNEEVRSFASLSSEAKAEWDARRAARRLEEAERMLQEGTLSAEAKAEIEKNFEAHAARVNDRIAEFESREDFRAAADISSNLETSLRVHERILAKLGEREEDEAEKDDAESLRARVEAKTVTTTEIRTNIERRLSRGPDVEAKVAAEGKLRSAESKIAEVRKFIDRKKDSLETEVAAEAEARLKVAEDTVVEGKVKLVADAHGEAFVLFQKAQRIAQEAKLLLEARRELRLELRLNGHAEEDEEDEDIEIDEEFEIESATSGEAMEEDNREEKREGGIRVREEGETEIEFEDESTTASGQLELRLGL